MARKEEILYAALELASENGLRGVSLSRIAEKVGIKPPSLYNHFGSKDEIVKAMYSFLREKAHKGRPSDPMSPDSLAPKSLERILLDSLCVYLDMLSDRDMTMFFRVLYSERSFDPLAAGILLEETERMVQSTKQLFYALAVHGKMKREGIDTAAAAFAFTVHSLVDHRMDMITAGTADHFGEDGKPYTRELAGFVKWFSIQTGGEYNEQKAD